MIDLGQVLSPVIGLHATTVDVDVLDLGQGDIESGKIPFHIPRMIVVGSTGMFDGYDAAVLDRQMMLWIVPGDYGLGHAFIIQRRWYKD